MKWFWQCWSSGWQHVFTFAEESTDLSCCLGINGPCRDSTAGEHGSSDCGNLHVARATEVGVSGRRTRPSPSVWNGGREERRRRWLRGRQKALVSNARDSDGKGSGGDDDGDDVRSQGSTTPSGRVEGRSNARDDAGRRCAWRTGRHIYELPKYPPYVSRLHWGTELHPEVPRSSSSACRREVGIHPGKDNLSGGLGRHDSGTVKCGAAFSRDESDGAGQAKSAGGDWRQWEERETRRCLLGRVPFADRPFF